MGLYIQTNTALFKADTQVNYIPIQKYHYLIHFGNFYDKLFFLGGVGRAF